MTTRYSCYDLIVESDFDLPELGNPTDRSMAADLIIRRGPVPEPEAAVDPTTGLWRTGEVCGIELPEIARYRIAQEASGTTITVEPHDSADPATVRLFLLGSAMGAAMMLRGCLVLHGNAVRIGDGCIVVLGHSGAGKSTLAAEFHRRGFDVLSDDVVPVENGLALPGYPRMKLWQDALERLGAGTDGLQRIHADHDKFHVPLRRSALGPLPVRAIYVLEQHRGDDLRVEPAQGAVQFALLHEHTYRNELIGSDGAAQHLQACAALLQQIRVRRIVRPAGQDTVQSSADLILADLDASPSGAIHPASTSEPAAVPQPEHQESR